MSQSAMTLYPTLDSLLELIKGAENSLPITDRNTLFALLMTYHNTLLNQLEKEDP